MSMPAHFPRRLALIGLGALALVLTFAAGRLTAPDSEPPPPAVIRYGAPSLGSGEDALVEVSGEFVERVVRDAVSQAELPFEFDQVETKYSQDGLALSGRAGVRVFGVPIRGHLQTLVRPYAKSDGTVGVSLVGTRAAGFRLPGSAEGLLESEINKELTKATALKGYSVRDVELGEHAMLLYLSIDERVASR